MLQQPGHIIDDGDTVTVCRARIRHLQHVGERVARLDRVPSIERLQLQHGVGRIASRKSVGRRRGYARGHCPWRRGGGRRGPADRHGNDECDHADERRNDPPQRALRTGYGGLAMP